MRDGERYARIDGDAALWGPLIAADELTDGDSVLIAVPQHGRPWAVAPGAPSGDAFAYFNA